MRAAGGSTPIRLRGAADSAALSLRSHIHRPTSQGWRSGSIRRAFDETHVRLGCSSARPCCAGRPGEAPRGSEGALVLALIHDAAACARGPAAAVSLIGLPLANSAPLLLGRLLPPCCGARGSRRRRSAHAAPQPMLWLMLLAAPTGGAACGAAAAAASMACSSAWSYSRLTRM